MPRPGLGWGACNPDNPKNRRRRCSILVERQSERLGDAGKTKVLVDRVVRLMLGGTEPSRIMCLTFTKAAAAEMANRLFERLSKWIALDDAAKTGLQVSIDAVKELVAACKGIDGSLA